MNVRINDTGHKHHELHGLAIVNILHHLFFQRHRDSIDFRSMRIGHFDAGRNKAVIARSVLLLSRNRNPVDFWRACFARQLSAYVFYQCRTFVAYTSQFSGAPATVVTDRAHAVPCRHDVQVNMAGV